MNRKNLFLFALLSLPLAAPLCAEEPAEKETSLTLVGGPQYVNEDDLGRGEARFKEFRDVPQGFAFEFGRFAWTPKDKSLLFSLTAIDAAQDDQRYFLDLTNPGRFSFTASYVELPRFYSSGSKTLWSGVGTGNLTLSDSFRQGAETAAGAPTAPFASGDLKAYMDAALAGASPLDLQTKRKDLDGALEFKVASGLTLGLTGTYGKREGTKPLGFGTYIRRQGLAGVPGTGAGSFWRETVESRGNELVEPLDHTVTEGGVTLTWAKKGHTVTAGWFGSSFANDITALYFDNPFEGALGRASATIFNPASDQEPGAPAGNNNLRGLYARSSTQLWPENTYNRLFANASFKLGKATRLSAVVARATMKQDDPFLPYAENDQVVSSEAGQPLELARNKALPQSSLDGEMTTTQADFRATSKIGPVALRAGYRHYGLEDGRPSIQFPGYSSSGDSYFRRGRRADEGRAEGPLQPRGRLHARPPDRRRRGQGRPGHPRRRVRPHRLGLRGAPGREHHRRRLQGHGPVPGERRERQRVLPDRQARVRGPLRRRPRDLRGARLRRVDARAPAGRRPGGRPPVRRAQRRARRKLLEGRVPGRGRGLHLRLRPPGLEERGPQRGPHLGEGRVAPRGLGRVRPVRVELLPGHQDEPHHGLQPDEPLGARLGRRRVLGRARGGRAPLGGRQAARRPQLPEVHRGLDHAEPRDAGRQQRRGLPVPRALGQHGDPSRIPAVDGLSEDHASRAATGTSRTASTTSPGTSCSPTCRASSRRPAARPPTSAT